ncbi:MAG: hypothetical protein GY820_34825 [Gammaproteobacteria bacterium]|nr:hypothetical protein [Gammaproteobacteria bacterium]
MPYMKCVVTWLACHRRAFEWFNGLPARVVIDNPNYESLISRLFNDKVLDNLRGAQGIVGFQKHYGKARLNAACLRALTFDNIGYRAIKQILEKGLDQQNLG